MSAELIGRQASVTFSGTEGSAIASTLIGRVARVNMPTRMRNVTRWADSSPRLTVEIMPGGSVTVSFTQKSMTPVVCSGAVGTLVVFTDTAAGKKRTFSVITGEISEESNTAGQSEPHRTSITFNITATGNTPANPIVAA